MNISFLDVPGMWLRYSVIHRMNGIPTLSAVCMRQLSFLVVYGKYPKLILPSVNESFVYIINLHPLTAISFRKVSVVIYRDNAIDKNKCEKKELQPTPITFGAIFKTFPAVFQL